MTKLLEEYKEYYRVRAERYADNPNYKHSYEAEKNLSEAMQSCSTLEEFKDKLGNLNQLCAIALTKDKSLMEEKLYTELNEPIRASVSKRVLEKVDNYTEVFDMMNMVNEENTQGMRDITLDEANRIFHECWMYLDRIEIYSEAVVPDNYKAEMQSNVEYYKKSILDVIKNTENQMRLLDPNWKHNPDIIKEHRHRVLLPYWDEHVEEQLSKYKDLTNL
jgi:hypothetical protein